MSMYGYKIVQTLVVDMEPDINVKRAMNEINVGDWGISSESSSVFIQHGPGAVKDIAMLIRDGLLQANASTI
ncbi:Hypersensitive-induced response protein 2 [Spatholobus suberectus]|nr:Hypersensitive-induced response protein 2 [Spatholobus suberectus]